jgi:hypothetical protein
VLLDILLSKYRPFLCLHEINIPLVSHPFDIFLANDLCRIICIVAVYRAPPGNFLQFLNNLDRVLNTIHRSGVEFIVM